MRCCLLTQFTVDHATYHFVSITQDIVCMRIVIDL